MDWKAIKYSLNSTLGTAGHKTLDYLIGQRTDVGSSSGSLHAKIADLKSSLLTEIGTRQKPRHSLRGAFQTSVTASLQTALSVSGKGSLKYLAGHISVGDINYNDRIRVTIDGVLFGAGYTNSGSSSSSFIVPNGAFWMGGANEIANIQTWTPYPFNYYTGENFLDNYYSIGNGFIDIPFTTSLLIQVIHISNSSVNFNWIYDIE